MSNRHTYLISFSMFKGLNLVMHRLSVCKHVLLWSLPVNVGILFSNDDAI
jgi:hypothetical protein